jgi:hypothetical protein
LAPGAWNAGGDIRGSQGYHEEPDDDPTGQVAMRLSHPLPSAGGPGAGMPSCRGWFDAHDRIPPGEEPSESVPSSSLVTV